jgi:class 3 adenylate cyclase
VQCPECQHKNPVEAVFCNSCGNRLELSCPSCGQTNPPGAKFCNKCGLNLSDTDVAASAQFASPESYTPKYLAERILTSKTSLEGERKQVTVLFADLKGSMEMLGDRDPEEARALLDAVLTRMMEAVHRFEGTVNQVMGDGIMALFGAPLALEDHALRACYAALAIQNSMQAYAEEARREHGVTLQTRVGMNSGEVVVRTIGSDLKMDYTAVGQTVNLAARMEQMAPPGSVYLTADTFRFAEGFVQVNPLGPVPIKGMSEAVEVFELKGAVSGRTRFQATAAGWLSRFVGRTNELDDLEEALHEAGEGHGQIFATVAEAGVGKSRLYWEFIRSPRTKDWLVVESGSVSYGKATAYKPVIDLLKAYFSIEDTDDHRRIREKVTGKVLTLDESLTPAIPPVLSLLEVPIEDEGWTNLDPPQRRQRTLDGVKGLLLREARVQPVCLVFEDLHWIDTETQAFLDSFVESLPGARVLLLVNYRPEYEHGWANKSYCTMLRLDPLSSEGADELLEAILGGDSALDPLKKLLTERTQGNPFYLEESVQTLIESGALAGGPGAYKLTEDVSKIEVPPTVQAILAARIDRLQPDDKRLLQTASVIGTHVPYPLLAAVAEMSEEELQKGLSALQASEFLYETNLFPEREFTFKHALTHEVTYGSLVQDRKRTLHAAIVEAIENLTDYRIEEHVERLAHHACEGEVWEKALQYLMQAGKKAVQRSANEEAIKHLTNGLQMLDTVQNASERDRRELDFQIVLGPVLMHAKGHGSSEVE